MWIATQDGFFSAVASDRDPGVFLVRTRCKADAVFLQSWAWDEHSADLEIIRFTQSDYPWRVVVPREVWGSYLVYASEQISYTNFKDRIGRLNKFRAGIYGSVWAVLLRVEDEDLPPSKRQKYTPWWEDDYRSSTSLPTATTSLFSSPALPLDEEDDEVQGALAAAGRSIHDLTEKEWQELMEEPPLPPLPEPRRRNRRSSRKAGGRR